MLQGFGDKRIGSAGIRICCAVHDEHLNPRSFRALDAIRIGTRGHDRHDIDLEPLSCGIDEMTRELSAIDGVDMVRLLALE